MTTPQAALDTITCPNCGSEEVVLINRCVHEHRASVYTNGELEWSGFDSDSCGAAAPPEPENLLYCDACDWDSGVFLKLDGDSITPEILKRALRPSCDKCREHYDAYGDGYAGLCPSCADKEEREDHA